MYILHQFLQQILQKLPTSIIPSCIMYVSDSCTRYATDACIFLEDVINALLTLQIFGR